MKRNRFISTEVTNSQFRPQPLYLSINHTPCLRPSCLFSTRYCFYCWFDMHLLHQVWSYRDTTSGQILSSISQSASIRPQPSDQRARRVSIKVRRSITQRWNIMIKIQSHLKFTLRLVKSRSGCLKTSLYDITNSGIPYHVTRTSVSPSVQTSMVAEVGWLGWKFHDKHKPPHSKKPKEPKEPTHPLPSRYQ